MKYIRTKDGRISYLDTEPYEDEPNYVVITNKGKINFYRPDQVVKQAETIEELCDMFCAIPFYDVCGVKAGKHYFVRKEEIEKFIPSVEIKTAELYGAIWTDKGLIYVAKMNDKGELMLL